MFPFLLVDHLRSRRWWRHTHQEDPWDFCGHEVRNVCDDAVGWAADRDDLKRDRERERHHETKLRLTGDVWMWARVTWLTMVCWTITGAPMTLVTNNSDLIDSRKIFPEIRLMTDVWTPMISEPKFCRLATLLICHRHTCVLVHLKLYNRHKRIKMYKWVNESLVCSRILIHSRFKWATVFLFN